MSFGGSAFGATAFGGASGSSAPVQTGPELQEIQSTEIEFQGLNGEAKVQLLPTAWPDDKLPPPSSSLLSVCSSRNFLAAAGPDALVFSSIDSVREAFKQQGTSGNTRPFKAQVTIPLSTRVSHVAFSSDGDCLVISAEVGGGLAAYDTKALAGGSTDTAFELGSNGESLRALVANPAPEFSELFAVVTHQGKLMVADLKSQSWRSAKNGPVYHENVSTVTWSSKGKALLAGLADGTMVQVKPDGTPMGQIPKPPTLEGGKHVSAVSWLENNLGIIIYTSGDADARESSEFYVWERSAGQNPNHTFSKLPEVGSSWGDRKPAAQYIAKLRDYHNCNHILFVANTASEDIGAVVKSKVALAEGAPTNTFVSVTQSNDARRAQLPMKPDFSASTSPIGMALDLASRDAVARPIPGGEEDSSPGPLPGLMVLNNDGVLAEWWVVYADAIRKGVRFTAESAASAGAVQPAQSQPQPTSTPSAFGAATNAQTPAFGKSSFGAGAAPSAFGQPSLDAAKPAFGQTSMGTSQPAFGQASMGTPKPAFGATSFGQPSMGAAKPAFGQPSSFGSPAALGAGKPAFGTPSTFGAAAGASPFGSTPKDATPKTPSSTFGQPSAFGGSAAANPGASQANPFGGTPKAGGVFGGNASTSSPFAQAAKPSADTTSPFGAAFASKGQGQGLFGPSTPSSFAAASKTQDTKIASPFAAAAAASTGQKSTFGSGGSFTSQTQTFGQPSQKANPFGQPGVVSQPSPFGQTAKDTADHSKDEKGSGFFGGSFGDALSTAAKEETKPAEDHEESMDDEAVPSKAPVSPEITQSTTPKETPAFQKTSSLFGTNPPPTDVPKSGGLFGASVPLAQTPKAGGLFGTPAETPKPPMPTISFTSDTPKPAPDEKQGADRSAGEIPLPPESTSKDTFTPTNSSAASSVDTLQGKGEVRGESAPLPPDFSKKSKLFAEDAPSFPPVTKPKSPVPPPVKTEEKAKEEAASAPLPPDFVPAKSKTAPKSEPPPLPAEDDSPIDDEGSGIDVANELSVEGSPESSFGSKSSNVFVSKPTSKTSKAAGSVFDEVPRPNIPHFSMPPPSKEPESPRSPSPVRLGRGTHEMKPPPFSSRSVSGPAIPKAGQGMRKPTQGRMQPPPTKFATPVASFASDRAMIEEERRAAEKKRQEQQAAEEQELSDDDDDYYRSVLSGPIEPTTKLGGFFAHTDYTGGVSKEGVPGQIEIVYRDANSMVDTLGMNARSIANWIAGHSVSAKKAKSSRQIEDLDDQDSWTLIDAEEVLGVERKIGQELEASAPGIKQAQVLAKLAKDMTFELNKLRRRNEEIARTVDNLKNDEEEDDIAGVAPLGAAAAESQQDLRRALNSFRGNLAKAEEEVTLMRAKLSSVAGEKQANGRSKVPTIEAVERTISKMTTMIERKSTELDVMIAQARQLGIVDERRTPSKGLLAYNRGRRSRSGSPFESPTTSRPGSSARSNYGTPLRGSIGQFTPSKSKLRSSVILAERMNGLTIGASGQAISDQAASRYIEKLAKKKEVKAALKDALDVENFRVRTLDDD